MPKTESNSAAETDQPQVPQYVQYAPPYAQPFEDDTIDLYELWITLWSKRWLVIGVTAVAAIGSVVFALLAPQIYKAEALLLPPEENKFQALNVQGVPGMEGERGVQGVQGISSGSVFAKFNTNLSSRILQKKFIKDYGLMELLAPERTPETRDEDIYEGFAEMIKIETKGSTSVSIELHDAEVAAQWVNDYIDFMDKETISKLIENIHNSIANQIRDIEYMIGSKREMAKLRRTDKIQEIEYSISSKREIAKKRRDDQINEIQYSIASKRELAKIRREDQINEIENSILSKMQIAKKRREDQIKGIEYSIASKRELAKTRREDQINKIETSLTSKRDLAKQRREDQIVRFKEAILIAETLGINKREDATNIIKNSQMNLDIVTSTNPLYYIGTEALKAEIRTLNERTSDEPFISGLRDMQENLSRLRAVKSDDPTIAGLRDLQEQLDRVVSIKSDAPFIEELRDLQEELALLRSIKSDDPFIGGLRDLQENLALLRSIKIDDEGLHAVSIDQAAYPPTNRIKPNRRLIVSLGTVVGLFLGIFLVFFVSFIQNQKETHSA